MDHFFHRLQEDIVVVIFAQTSLQFAHCQFQPTNCILYAVLLSLERVLLNRQQASHNIMDVTSSETTNQSSGVLSLLS